MYSVGASGNYRGLDWNTVQQARRALTDHWCHFRRAASMCNVEPSACGSRHPGLSLLIHNHFANEYYRCVIGDSTSRSVGEREVSTSTSSHKVIQ